MCYQLTEVYSACQCTYYKHSIDRCKEFGRPRHDVQRRTILVGSACPQHTLDRFAHKDESVRFLLNYCQRSMLTPRKSPKSASIYFSSSLNVLACLVLTLISPCCHSSHSRPNSAPPPQRFAKSFRRHLSGTLQCSSSLGSGGSCSRISTRVRRTVLSLERFEREIRRHCQRHQLLCVGESLHCLEAAAGRHRR